MTDIKLTPMNIRRATRKLTEARERAQAAEADWQAKIRIAVRQGIPVIEVAEAAGISRERVYQIRDGRR